MRDALILAALVVDPTWFECRRDRSREQSRAITAAVRALGIRRADYLATYGFSARVAQELITSTQLEGARP